MASPSNFCPTCNSDNPMLFPVIDMKPQYCPDTFHGKWGEIFRDKFGSKPIQFKRQLNTPYEKESQVKDIYKPLADRINALKPEGVDLSGDSEESTELVRKNYEITTFATERQMTHIKSHLRMLRIKFDVKEV